MVPVFLFHNLNHRLWQLYFHPQHPLRFLYELENSGVTSPKKQRELLTQDYKLNIQKLEDIYKDHYTKPYVTSKINSMYKENKSYFSSALTKISPVSGWMISRVAFSPFLTYSMPDFQWLNHNPSKVTRAVASLLYILTTREKS